MTETDDYFEYLIPALDAFCEACPEHFFLIVNGTIVEATPLFKEVDP